MPKRNGANGKAPTHFETLPVEVVKEIAIEDFPTAKKFRVGTEQVERPAMSNVRMPVPAGAPTGKKR